MADLTEIAKSDPNYQSIKSAIVEGTQTKDLPPDHPGRVYKADWNLLAVDGELITIGDRILVPKNARKDILKNLHIAHLGQHKTLALARTLYYWKQMQRDIIQLIEECETCQVHANFQAKEPLKQTVAEGPMHMNSVDIAEYANKYYLVHADRFSNFLWVYKLKKITTGEVMTALWRTFYQMGFPTEYDSLLKS